MWNESPKFYFADRVEDEINEPYKQDSSIAGGPCG